MKLYLRRFLIFSAALWVLLGACPLVTVHLMPDTLQASPTPSAVPDTMESGQNVVADTFRILDESNGMILTVPEADFLTCALLCEMSPDAPAEALKAQIVAIHTTCSRLRRQNTEEAADFSCNTQTRSIYAPPEVFAAEYGDDWEAIRTQLQALCAEVSDQCLYYEEALITAPYFAVSAGCTQPYEDVWGGEPLPYLQSLACPSDLLHGDFRAEVRFTPEEIREAFPAISFSEDPGNWFSSPQQNSAGYVTNIEICGTALSGTQVRSALSLRSAAFTVLYDGEEFVFTTLGLGHGVGMSQAGAIYMAENGTEYTDILAYFYPGTELK